LGVDFSRCRFRHSRASAAVIILPDAGACWKRAGSEAAMMAEDKKTTPEKPFLTTKEAAVWLGLTRNTLEKWRVHGGGPAYRKHGRYVRYHMEDLIAWSEANKRSSTSDVR
jgi:excisionase family DNA binding protein